MKKSKNHILSALVATGIAGGGMVMPAASQAEVETTLHMHTMNMFRGQSESEFAPALHGEIEYSHSSGVYAGTEIVNSSEGGVEWDLMYGYEREMGDFNFNLGMVHYMFPGATEDADGDSYTTEQKRSSISDSTETEFKIGVGFREYSLTYYTNTDSAVDATYISLDYQGKKFGVHYGITESSEDDPFNPGEKEETNYSDLALSYALTDEVTFTISKAMGDAVGNEIGDVEGDPLVMLSYQIPLGKHGD